MSENTYRDAATRKGSKQRREGRLAEARKVVRKPLDKPPELWHTTATDTKRMKTSLVTERSSNASMTNLSEEGRDLRVIVGRVP
jgi:hypothetical protein